MQLFIMQGGTGKFKHEPGQVDLRYQHGTAAPFRVEQEMQTRSKPTCQNVTKRLFEMKSEKSNKRLRHLNVAGASFKV